MLGDLAVMLGERGMGAIVAGGRPTEVLIGCSGPAPLEYLGALTPLDLGVVRPTTPPVVRVPDE